MPTAQTPFESFLKAGSFGIVAVGAAIRDVEDYLGAPDDVGSGSKGWRGLRYGDLQIWWYSNQPVHLIGIYFRRAPDDRPSLPDRLQTEVPFTGATKRNELESYLDKHGIPWSLDNRLAGVTNLHIGACVTASFDPETGHLDSLIASADRSLRV